MSGRREFAIYDHLAAIIQTRHESVSPRMAELDELIAAETRVYRKHAGGRRREAIHKCDCGQCRLCRQRFSDRRKVVEKWGRQHAV